MVQLESPPIKQRWLYPRTFFSPPHIAVQAWERFRELARYMIPGKTGEALLGENGAYLQGVLAHLQRVLAEDQSDGPQDLYRTVGRQVRSSLNSLAGSVELAVAPTETRKWAEIHACVESLPEPEQDVVDLILYAGLSDYQTADLLGLTLDEVEQLWDKVQTKWKGILGGCAWRDFLLG